MCCLFGLIDYSKSLNSIQKSMILSVLSRECEVRGKDAAGIAYNSSGNLKIYKRPTAAHDLHFKIPNDACVIMGHTRMTTQGSEKYNENNHPFYGSTDNTKFALAHNGMIINDTHLRLSLSLPHTHIQTDSYIAVQLIEQKKTLDFESLRYMAEKVEGSFTFTLLDEQNNVYIIKGDNPLCIFHYPSIGVYLYASTEEILKKALWEIDHSFGRYEKIDISCGDILKINSDGTTEKSAFEFTDIFYRYFFPRCRHPRHIKKRKRESTYIQQIKTVAGYFGYSPEDVDFLIDMGYTPEDLEELFYTGVL